MASRDTLGYLSFLYCLFLRTTFVGAASNRTVDIASVCEKDTFGYVKYTVEREPFQFIWNGDIIRSCRISFETQSSNVQLCMSIVKNQVVSKDKYIIVSTTERGVNVYIEYITSEDLPNIPHCARNGLPLSVLFRNIRQTPTKNNSLLFEVFASEISETIIRIHVTIFAAGAFIIVIVIALLSVSKGETGDADADEDGQSLSEYRTTYSEIETSTGLNCRSDISY